jgi:hypothetical protein
MHWLRRVHDRLYSLEQVRRWERFVIGISTVGFLAHLAMIAWSRNSPGALNFGWLSSSYLSALYTPFSFLLFFEVLLLVGSLPESFSRSIAKQYEIVTLIVVRRVFKDIAKLDDTAVIELTSPDALFVAADMVGALALFAMALTFRRGCASRDEPTQEVRAFVTFKYAVSLALGVVVVVFASWSLFVWGTEMWHVAHGRAAELSDVNAVFYQDFFGLLVLVDVLVLVVSLGFTHDHDQVFRNAGYVASTVLVRLSFQAERFESLVVLLFALAFALGVQRVTRSATDGASRAS